MRYCIFTICAATSLLLAAAAAGLWAWSYRGYHASNWTTEQELPASPGWHACRCKRTLVASDHGAWIIGHWSEGWRVDLPPLYASRFRLSLPMPRRS